MEMHGKLLIDILLLLHSQNAFNMSEITINILCSRYSRERIGIQFGTIKDPRVLQSTIKILGSNYNITN